MEKPNSARRFLQVPYAEKDEAKALGARWDPDYELWYVPQGIARKHFRWPDAADPKPVSPARQWAAPRMKKFKPPPGISREAKGRVSPAPSTGTSDRLQRELSERLQFLLDDD
jgi:hypothetical protein